MRGSRIPRVASLVGAEAVLKLRVLRSQPRLRCVLGLPRRGSTSGTTPSATLMGQRRRSASRPRRPPHHAFDASSSSRRAARRSPLAADEEEPHPNGNPRSDQEHSFLIGLGTRVRVLDTVYVSAEYVQRVSGFANGDDHLSVAFEKRAGGHLCR